MALPVAIQVVRWTHILAGFTAFFIVPVPLLTAKGGTTHRRWGKIYFWAMAVVALTAMVLALWLPILFLALVAVFSFYFAFRGYRALTRKLPLQGQGPSAVDWAAAALALLGSGADRAGHQATYTGLGSASSGGDRFRSDRGYVCSE